MEHSFDRKIVFEDGREVYGYGFGSYSEKICEIVFNTSMVGYQEILSDPSYTYQAVVMTYPWIGNYGINDDDHETRVPTIGGMIVREYNDDPSYFRATKTVDELMKAYDIVGIEGVDTRELTRLIRDFGSRKVLITDASKPLHECLELLGNGEVPTDAVSRVSCKKIWESPADSSIKAADIKHVVAIDCGMKLNIVRSLNKLGCRVTVVPWNTSADDIKAMKPDGIFVSNGPGDPTDIPETIATIRQLIGFRPIFGICLGHQLIALAYGAKTYKLKFGHRGGNHPVKNAAGKIEITSQNHSYAVEADTLKGTGLNVTHVNLLDNTVEGMECVEDSVFSVQYHPESAPGPQDSRYLFSHFTELMEERS
ncbi:MAG: glutamine-hydrolyzing carbamoyl-phosphate synthase small subunit [Lachnospiraceae bacterium]|nr:glutamine-hydrolyzing carbamoyl-phosphate synthase small subunit [Lachnospiraceae bacterium]